MGIANSVEYNSLNYMDRAFAPVLLSQKQAVLKDTWGHLAPVRGKSYRGYIVFTKTAYGDLSIVDSDFNNLPDSPWLFDAMNDFVFADCDSLIGGAHLPLRRDVQEL
jgi:hypothetical protein